MASIDESLGRTIFGSDPAGYDAARPGYPPALFDWLTQQGALRPGAACFEIGPGTGQATAPVLARGPASLIGLEPDPVLASYLRTAIPDPRLTLATETFETADLPDAAFDFGFAATSFHWLSRGKALAKARRSLKPGGHLALWWNIYHDPRAPDAFARASERLFDGIEQVAWTAASASALQTPFGLDAPARMGEMRQAGFVDVRHALFHQTVTFTPDRIAGLFASFSRVAKAPPERRQRLLDGGRDILAREFGGSLDRTIACSAYLARRP